MLAYVFAPFPRVVPMQVEQDVALVVGSIVNDLLDQITIRLASILLLGGFAKPPVLRKGNPDDVRLPILDGDLYGIE